MMKAQMKGISLMIILLMLVLTVQAAALRGTVTDKATKEPLIGAAVQLSGTNTGTITDVDGNFELAGLRNGTYKLIISYVSYCTQTVEVTINGMFEIKVELEQDNQQLGEVVVVADAKKNTENAIITQQRTSLVMQTGVSAQQITKTQDKDASEVIRRVPGISIIVWYVGFHNGIIMCGLIIVPYLVLKPMRVLSLSILFHRRSWIICW